MSVSAMKIYRAFSLIELLVVIAIISIVSAIALPAYKEYTVKTKLFSIVAVMHTPMQKATTYYNANGVFPDAVSTGNDPKYAQVGLTSYSSLNSDVIDGVYVNSSCSQSPYPGYFCMAVAINANVFPEGGQRQLYFIGREEDGAIKWYCVSPTAASIAIPDAKYLPTGCTY